MISDSAADNRPTRLHQERDRSPPVHSEPAASKEPPRGIDFSIVLRRSDGNPQTEAPLLTLAQIAQFASSMDFPTLMERLRQAAEQKDQMTLARACEIALDVGLDADKNEGIKLKLARGALIDKILSAAREGRELTLESEDVSMIKNRVGSVFQQASLVRQICMLIDPGVK